MDDEMLAAETAEAAGTFFQGWWVWGEAKAAGGKYREAVGSRRCFNEMPVKQHRATVEEAAWDHEVSSVQYLVTGACTTLVRPPSFLKTRPRSRGARGRGRPPRSRG